MPNSNFGRQMRCLRDICDFSLEPFLGVPGLTLRGRRMSNVKVVQGGFGGFGYGFLL